MVLYQMNYGITRIERDKQLVINNNIIYGPLITTVVHYEYYGAFAMSVRLAILEKTSTNSSA